MAWLTRTPVVFQEDMQVGAQAGGGRSVKVAGAGGREGCGSEGASHSSVCCIWHRGTLLFAKHGVDLSKCKFNRLSCCNPTGFQWICTEWRWSATWSSCRWHGREARRPCRLQCPHFLGPWCLVLFPRS